MDKYIGNKYGRYTVLEKTNIKFGSTYKYKCRCECGTEKNIAIHHLVNGSTVSCGCWRKERCGDFSRKHGKRNSRLYVIWRDMKARCSNSKTPNSRFYFQKGITVCDDWKNSFEEFYDWATSNGYNEDLTLDRIDNSKGYTPTNCRWVTPKEQAHNRTNNVYATLGEKTMICEDWDRYFRRSSSYTSQRLKKGKTIKELYLRNLDRIPQNERLVLE